MNMNFQKLKKKSLKQTLKISGHFGFNSFFLFTLKGYLISSTLLYKLYLFVLVLTTTDLEKKKLILKVMIGEGAILTTIKTLDVFPGEMTLDLYFWYVQILHCTSSHKKKTEASKNHSIVLWGEKKKKELAIA